MLFEECCVNCQLSEINGVQCSTSLDLFLSPSFLVCLLAASVCVSVCEKQLHANTQAHIHTHAISEQIFNF